MKCPKCQFENREGARFCKECGARLESACPGCGESYALGTKFCDHCGQDLRLAPELRSPVPTSPASYTPKHLADQILTSRSALEPERKQITVLFSDLSGYTAMTEKLDPEEVKEIMGRIFGEIAQVVAQYEGWIHQLIGDQAMILFGVPKTHEDDPFRAIRAAQEIHDRVDALSLQFEQKIGWSLSLHSGIHTGLAVIGDLDLERKTYSQVTGDTINLAARLCDLAPSGEIWVGPETYRRTQGDFTFEALRPTRVQGKAESTPVYRVFSAKERPAPAQHLSGLRADLIGRKAELAQLADAVQRLREGRGTILSICGDPGTGKSRLVAEFKATLDLRQIQWLEARAYAYFFGERAKEIAILSSDDQIFFNTVCGMVMVYWGRGERRKAFEAGQVLLKQAEECGDIRGQVLGDCSIGISHIVAGDFPSARENLESATQISVDPLFSQFSRLLLGICLISMNRFQEAKEALTKVLEHSLRFGSALGTPARTLLAVVTIAEGRLAQGFKILERIQKEYLTNGNKCLYVMGEYLIGKIYAQFSAGSPAQIPLIRNLGFILRNLPFAHRRAQEHLGRSVAVAEEIGARCMAGMGYLDLGLFHAATGKRTLSRDCLTKARDLFEQCEAEVYLKQAKEALESLDGDYS